MNDNYIPEEEDFLEPTPSTESPVPTEPEIETEYTPVEPEAALEAESFGPETMQAEFTPEEAAEVCPEFFEEIPSEDQAAEEASLRTDTDAEVTDIILETLAQQEPEELSNAEMPALDGEDAEQPMEALIQEHTEEPVYPQEPLDDEHEFHQLFEQKTATPVTPKKERPVKKGRPKRRKGSGLLSIPHMLSVVIWLLIIVAIGVSLGRIIWVCAADVLAFGRESKEVSISITADDTMESIAEKLHDAGLINIPELFLLYADLADVEEENKITTGTFTLNTIYDYNALVNHMGPRATNRVVVEDVLIPEGFNCRQIFALMEEKNICKVADLEAYAANGKLDDYWFLENVQRGDKYCLEGFLFPDTYDFYENSSPKLVLEKLLDGFQYRFTEELNTQIPALNELLTAMMRENGENEEFIAANQLTLRDVLTVASMIEEETAGTKESPRIASVIYNRLFRWGDNPRYLNIDASIIYALDGKTNLTAEDMAVDSPYNTYTHTGLTPGPISNPGLASIQAALKPEDTGYYYYVLNPSTGEHQFSKTYEEHTKYVEQFREAQNNE